jgi:hypothetical protein
MKIKVSNLGGVVNQFTIEVQGYGVYFQSYQTVIAHQTPDGAIELDHKWQYSKTTSKHLHRFLNEDLKSVADKVKRGLYKVVDLNG